MNLNKIEKIFIMVLVIGIVVGVGIALFVMPAKDKIDAANRNLSSLQKEQEELNASLAREATIDKEIDDAKKEAQALEGNFYPDLTTYEAVEITLAYLEESKLDTLGITATTLSTEELSLEILEQKPVIYDLKTYSQTARGTDEDALLEGQFKDGNKVYTVTANGLNDVVITDEEGSAVEPKDYTDTMADAHKEALCRLAASSELSQTVGVTQVTFDVTGTYGDYLKFIDYIYGLERASYMDSVTIPMTADPEFESEDDEEIVEAVEEELGVELKVPLLPEDEIEQSVTVRFFSVEQMEELEKLEAAGVEIVVNQ